MVTEFLLTLSTTFMCVTLMGCLILISNIFAVIFSICAESEGMLSVFFSTLKYVACVVFTNFVLWVISEFAYFICGFFI